MHYGELAFDLRVILQQKLNANTHEYFPMVISINYNQNGQNFAFIAYYTFILGGGQGVSSRTPTAVKLIKQCIIVNGLPFEIKSIYGLDIAGDGKSDKAQLIKGQAEDDSSKECTICMSVDSNCIIMPCGHLCCCTDCGKNM